MEKGYINLFLCLGYDGLTEKWYIFLFLGYDGLIEKSIFMQWRKVVLCLGYDGSI